MATQIPIAEAEQFKKPETALTVIERAILDPNLSADKLAILLDVQLRYEANEARKRFEAAMFEFKRNVPVILRTKHVSIKTKGGDLIEYDHAELDKIVPILNEALMAVGITHYWKTGGENGSVKVTCVLKGFNHTEDGATMVGPPDTSGVKNPAQAVASTVTLFERYTLLASLGMAAKGTDTDGRPKTGLSETAIDEYCISLNDCAHFEELKGKFAEAWQAAKSANDRNAQERIHKVYETRKKEIFEAAQ